MLRFLPLLLLALTLAAATPGPCPDGSAQYPIIRIDRVLFEGQPQDVWIINWDAPICPDRNAPPLPEPGPEPVYRFDVILPVISR